MEAVAGIAAGLIVLLVVAVIAQSFLHSRESMRERAQSKACDEVMLAYTEKMHSRIMALAFPNSHVTYREKAGPQLDGAQRDIRPHYLNGKDTAGKVDHEEKKLAVVRDQVKLEQERLRAAQLSRRGITPVGTALDFEQDEPGQNLNGAT